MIRVVIVDDEHLMRSGLRMMMESAGDIEVVGEAGDGDEALELIERTRPHVVLMDIRMPGKDGLKATEELTAHEDGPKVIVLTTFGEDTYIYRALSAGAVGFLLKDTPPEDLVAAVRKAHLGQAVLDPAITRSVIAHFTDQAPGHGRQEARDKLDVLTGREMEVLACLGEGMSNAEIGQRLRLSETTVKSHVSRVMEKLHCANRTQAAILAYEAGLVTK
ncbi:response regulator transcription factor [Catelliglobosispora koreensis]|uniref:response regulator transcription factor n=1 Tax=Catelliglobosispora koreensis TaxID=129052 RepID=UPI00036EE5F2|nr:response regulator transcription factor [Catelliglobosispora koreensis]